MAGNGSVWGIAVVSGFGGGEFRRELVKAEKALGLETSRIKSLTGMGRRADLLRLLRGHAEDVETLMLFCHGWPTSLSGMGIQRPHIPALAECIQDLKCQRVVLYACLTASEWVKPKLGKPKRVIPWAVDLSKTLPDVEIYAHTTAGHTTHNPYVQRIVNGDAAWLIAPGSVEWRQWNAELHDEHSLLRFEYPWLSAEEIQRQYLAADRWA